MNLRYYYWYYKNALPDWLCDALVSSVLKNQNIKTGLITAHDSTVLKNMEHIMFQQLAQESLFMKKHKTQDTSLRSFDPKHLK